MDEFYEFKGHAFLIIFFFFLSFTLPLFESQEHVFEIKKIQVLFYYTLVLIFLSPGLENYYPATSRCPNQN